MEIRVKFVAGPLADKMALTDRLEPCKIFLDGRERRVLLYLRIDELVYVYDHSRSVKLTKKYDEVKRQLCPDERSSLRWDAGEDEGD